MIQWGMSKYTKFDLHTQCELNKRERSILSLNLTISKGTYPAYFRSKALTKFVNWQRVRERLRKIPEYTCCRLFQSTKVITLKQKGMIVITLDGTSTQNYLGEDWVTLPRTNIIKRTFLCS